MEKPEPWQAVGSALKERWRDAIRVPGVEHEMPKFSKAIYGYLEGDHTEIVVSHQLSRDDQAELAWALEERARPKLGRPPTPEHMDRKLMAELALSFYDDWKKENARLGIRDWGHRKEMKRQACEFVYEYTDEMTGSTSSSADVDAIEDLLSQPKSRRK
jgi:hypothetical protein